MNYRECLYLPFLHFSLLCSPLVFGADVSKNADALVREAHGAWVAEVPGGIGTTELSPILELPTAPQPHIPLPDNLSADTGQSSLASGAVGLIVNLGKTSEKEKAAEAARLAAERALRAGSKTGHVAIGGSVDHLLNPDAYINGLAKNSNVLPFPPYNLEHITQTATTVAQTTASLAEKTNTLGSIPPLSLKQASEILVKKSSHLTLVGKTAANIANTASSSSDTVQTAAAIGGTAAAAKTGFLGSMVASAKAAGAYVVSVAAANPVGAAVVGGAFLVGGGYAAYRYMRQPVLHTSPLIESAAHREIHDAQQVPNLIPDTGKRNLRNSEKRHSEQTGNPRDKGIKPYTIKKPGQGDKPHGYKDDWGHYADYNPKTEAKSFECYERGTYHGRNKDGNHVFTMTDHDSGKQLWVHVRDDGGINNCGVNPLHMPIHPEQGLPYQPDAFKKPSGNGYGDTLKTVTVGTGGAALMSSSTTAAPTTIPEHYVQKTKKTVREAAYWDNPYRDMLHPDFDMMPEVPGAVTPEKAARKAARVRRAIENTVDQYSKEFIEPKPYTPEEKLALRNNAREQLSQYLKDEL